MEHQGSGVGCVQRSKEAKHKLQTPTSDTTSARSRTTITLRIFCVLSTCMPLLHWNSKWSLPCLCVRRADEAKNYSIFEMRNRIDCPPSAWMRRQRHLLLRRVAAMQNVCARAVFACCCQIWTKWAWHRHGPQHSRNTSACRSTGNQKKKKKWIAFVFNCHSGFGATVEERHSSLSDDWCARLGFIVAGVWYANISNSDAWMLYAVSCRYSNSIWKVFERRFDTNQTMNTNVSLSMASGRSTFGISLD